MRRHYLFHEAHRNGPVVAVYRSIIMLEGNTEIGQVFFFTLLNRGFGGIDIIRPLP